MVNKNMASQGVSWVLVKFKLIGVKLFSILDSNQVQSTTIAKSFPFAL